MTMQFDFDGLDELIQEIDRIEGLTQDLKDEALVEGGDLLLKELQEVVYGDSGLRRQSGDALESLTRTEPKNNELFVGTKGGVKQPGYYLYMHEVGYYNVRAKEFQPPKGFASRTYENNKNNILNKYLEVFRKGMGMK